MKITIEKEEKPNLPFPQIRLGVGTGNPYFFASEDSRGVALSGAKAGTTLQNTVPLIGTLTITQGEIK